MSDTTLYRLAPHVAVEPLVARWVAWPHTVAPVLGALHLLNYQVPTLRSFVRSPAVHAISCRNPNLLGGPFVNIDVERANEVATLLDEAETAKPLFDFARTYTDFQNRLANVASGQSLSTYYSDAPPPLRGIFELLYDYFDHPIVRPMEALTYRKSLYRREAQSLQISPLARDYDRAYFMSTPRLPNPAAIDWATHFDNAAIDDLFALDEKPKALGAIGELLGLDYRDEDRLIRLVSEGGGKMPSPPQAGEVRVRYFGHACALIEARGVSILIDPLVAVRPTESDVERFSYDDLPEKIDYALVTHGHHDHFVIETLLRLRRRIGALVVPKSSGIFHGDISLKLLARHIGFRNIIEVDALESIEIPGGEIIALPFLGEHNDLPSAKSAYAIRIGDKRVMFAADSNCLDPKMYELVVDVVGPIDTLFVGMECVGAPLTWVYGPILPVKPTSQHSKDRRSNGCDATAALALARVVRCRQCFVYAVGREPWVQYLLALTPKEDDVYMKEIGRFISNLADTLRVQGRLLYGRAEISL